MPRFSKQYTTNISVIIQNGQVRSRVSHNSRNRSARVRFARYFWSYRTDIVIEPTSNGLRKNKIDDFIALLDRLAKPIGDSAAAIVLEVSTVNDFPATFTRGTYCRTLLRRRKHILRSLPRKQSAAHFYRRVKETLRDPYQDGVRAEWLGPAIAIRYLSPLRLCFRSLLSVLSNPRECIQYFSLYSINFGSEFLESIGNNE